MFISNKQYIWSVGCLGTSQAIQYAVWAWPSPQCGRWACYRCTWVVVQAAHCVSSSFKNGPRLSQCPRYIHRILCNLLNWLMFYSYICWHQMFIQSWPPSVVACDVSSAKQHFSCPKFWQVTQAIQLLHSNPVCKRLIFGTKKVWWKF